MRGVKEASLLGTYYTRRYLPRSHCIYGTSLNSELTVDRSIHRRPIEKKSKKVLIDISSLSFLFLLLVFLFP